MAGSRLGATHKRLRRDVMLALMAKLAVLTAIYFLFFGPADQPAADAGHVAAQVLGAGAAQGGR